MLDQDLFTRAEPKTHFERVGAMAHGIGAASGFSSHDMEYRQLVMEIFKCGREAAN